MLPLNNSYITSEYGIKRSDNKIHTGLDIISKSGDRSVRAIKGGICRGAYWDSKGYGNYVTVQHDDGTRAMYCHLASIKPISAGTRIEEGTVLGIEGTTGNSTGVHLHLELRKAPYTAKDHIDVAKYLNIKNQKGVVIMEEKDLNTQQKIEIIKQKVGYDDNTCKYMFELYKYGPQALDKLVKALK